jgi:hypothetical protein
MIKVRRIALLLLGWPALAFAHSKTTRDAQNMQMNNRKDEAGTTARSLTAARAHVRLNWRNRDHADRF